MTWNLSLISLRIFSEKFGLAPDTDYAQTAVRSAAAEVW